jgi:hypothetical protein
MNIHWTSSQNHGVPLKDHGYLFYVIQRIIETFCAPCKGSWRPSVHLRKDHGDPLDIIAKTMEILRVSFFIRDDLSEL